MFGSNWRMISLRMGALLCALSLCPHAWAWLNNGDLTISDQPTGLMWDACPVLADTAACSGLPQFFTWANALAKVDALNAVNHRGYSDWRLPNVKELSNLADGMGPGAGFVDEFNGFPYWSSTTYATNPAYAWTAITALYDINFGLTDKNIKTGVSLVRLVRGGASFSAANLSLQPQTVTFGPAPINMAVGRTGTVLATSASPNSGNPITYTSKTSAVCTVDASGVVTGLLPGECLIEAYQEGNATYNPASATLTFVIGRGAQTLTFPAQSPQPYSPNGTFLISPLATASTPNSGNSIVYSSRTPFVCKVNPFATSEVLIVYTGTCVIDANMAGDTNFYPATQATQSITITKGVQTLTFGAQSPSSQPYSANGTFPINPLASSATPNSGNPIAYSSATPTVCSVSGSAVTILGGGICTVAADQAGDLVYNAATQATQNINITPAAQTIVFPTQSPVSQPYGPSRTFPINPLATSAAPNSGNPVTYISNTPAVCLVNGSTVTILTLGTCTVAADQAGNVNYLAALTATQSIVIGKGSQVLTFATQSPSSQPYRPNGTFPINPLASSASPNSGNPVSYSITTPTVCSVSGSTVTILNIGTCTIAADQLGNANYTDASRVTQDVVITKGVQTLTFAAQIPSNQTYGANATFPINPLASSATPNSGNTITYSSATPTVCSVSGSTVTVLGAGTCTVAADQTSNILYNAATQVTQTVVIGQAAQTLTFAAQSPASQIYSTNGTFPINPLATSASPNSSKPIIYSSATPTVCTVNGTIVNIVSGGTCLVTADQLGNANYLAATTTTQSISIMKASQSISITPRLTSVKYGEIVTLVASADSGLPVTFVSLTPSVCLVSISGQLQAIAGGICTFTANQLGSSSFLPANATITLIAEPPLVSTLDDTALIVLATLLVVAGYRQRAAGRK